MGLEKTRAIGLLFLAASLGCQSEVEFKEIPQRASTGFDQLNDDVDEIAGYEKVSESFRQSTQEPKVDILFVIDNSISMTEEQVEIGKKIGSFLDHFSGVDWQIGITTTDVSNGNHGLKGSLVELNSSGQKILNKKTKDYELVFKDNVLRSESINCGNDCPSGNEMPLRASILAMEKHDQENKGFFRNNSELIFVYLSDEDEDSTGPASATRADEVIDSSKDIFGAKKSVRAYGLIVEPGDSACLNKFTGHYYGSFVAEFAHLTNGSTGSICAESYAPALSRIGKDIERHLSSIVLKSPPALMNQAGKFKIELKPKVPGASWSVQGRKVSFSVQLPAGTQIMVEYLREL